MATALARVGRQGADADLLAPNGKLVAVMSAGITFHTTKTAKRFRALVDEHGTVDLQSWGSPRV